MKVLIVGSGGREHALAWKLKQSPQVTQVICAPGNPGMAELGACHNIVADDLNGLLNLAKQERVGLTVVGPELPLCLGIVDLFQKNGLLIAGPDAYAAQLEGSKSFAKQAMTRFGVPTASFQIFDAHKDALAYINQNHRPLVIKADGLAAGKGVYLCRTNQDAQQALHDIMVSKVFGSAGEKVVIEEWVYGEEASFLVFSDGEKVLPMPSSQDHKPIGEGDVGPNTGGMGAYSPAPVISERLQRKVMEQAIDPIIKGMAAEEHPFRGILYAGLMISADGSINVLEYNVRFGDPECQPLLMRLESDLFDILLAVAKGSLLNIKPVWSLGASVCVVLAAKGYPGDYEKGDAITGLDDADSDPAVQVFQAGTALLAGQLVTNGGRVLGVCAKAPELGKAVELAYAAIEKIHFSGMYCRRDIAHRALKPRSGSAQVAIMMGSVNDWGAMKGTQETLDSLGVSSEVKVLSAHRTPDETLAYVRGLAVRGIKVVIAGAGWAAHLAGVAAANTLLPVIGVPLDSSPLAGMDALLSTVQMPPGIPVATVAVGPGGAKNAAFLAAQIISLQDGGLRERLQAHREKAAQDILNIAPLA